MPRVMSWPRKKHIKKIIEEQSTNTDIDNMLNYISGNPDEFLTNAQIEDYQVEALIA